MAAGIVFDGKSSAEDPHMRLDMVKGALAALFAVVSCLAAGAVEIAEKVFQFRGVDRDAYGAQGVRCVTYGGPASSAKIKDSRISGTGMLWATKGLPGGFIINFR